jgi:hydroxymethylglutaryl-CoA lyase
VTGVLALPERVTVAEVGPRDGLQSFDRWVPTDDKVALVDCLSEAGFPVVEAASFASPRVVPHLRDASEVLERITRRPGTIYRALAPNRKGLERALACEVDEVLALCTVSAEYTRRNQGMTVQESTAQAADVYRSALDHGRGATVAVGMALFCPYEGRIPEVSTLAVVDALYRGDVRRIYIAGSLGMEDPRQVSAMITHLKDRWPDLEVGFHAHDMAGFGAANVLAAVQAGATSVEGSICGIGGGVVLPHGASQAGNLATEDLVHMLNCSGVVTGIETPAVLRAARRAADILHTTPRGRLTFCGPRDEIASR